MIRSWLERVATAPGEQGEPPLRIRLFRLVCAAVVGLMVGLVIPMNLVQDLPVLLHVASVVFALWSATCYFLSRRGVHLCGAYLLCSVALLDGAWFGNGGSQGSITFYMLPVLLVSMVILEGRQRLAAFGLIVANTVALYGVEWAFPQLTVPYASLQDRYLDHITSIVAVAAITLALLSVILESYRRERQRLSEVASQLRNSEEHLREIYDSTSDALFVHASDGRPLDVNARASALFGASREALLVGLFDQFSLGEPPYSRAEAQVRLAQAAAGQPQVFEWCNRRSNGELFWTEVALRGCEIGGEGRVIASVRDIGPRKQAEEELRRNEERLRLSMVATAQGWFELNVQTGKGVSSPEYVRILGFDPASFQTSFEEWQAGLHSDDREKTIREFHECIASGRTHTMEYRRSTPAGGWKWIRSVGKIVTRDAAGRPLLMCGTHTDVTERKELERQLMHSQRLEAVGTLASGVAHDLNNILTPIVMASGVLMDKLHDPEDRELMRLMDAGGRRGAAIVKQLLAFSRNQAQERVPVDLWQLVRETLQMVKTGLAPNVAVVQPGEGRGLVRADSTQLHQVLMNLCVNARDAMPGGGTLTVGLTREQLPVEGSEDRSLPRGGPYLVLSVTDTGGGIAPGIMEKIFDPFFTTKSGGTGLGLASVHGIVKAHHGFVRVESVVGQGTTFRIHLPELVGEASGDRARVPPGAAPEAGASDATTFVLLVDDNPAVLAASRRSLERGGFEVLTAINGRQALETTKMERARIGLVITDFSMPEMDGPTLLRELRVMGWDRPVIGVSGCDQTQGAESFRKLGFTDFLGKPYESAELLAKVRAHLPRGRPGLMS